MSKESLQGLGIRAYAFFFGLWGFKGGLYFGTFGGETRLLLSKSPSSVFGFGPGLIADIFIVKLRIGYKKIELLGFTS